MTHILIALEHENGQVSRMQFGVSRKRHQLHPEFAQQHGFSLRADTWRREATDAAIQKEIDRTKWLHGRVVKWWRVKDESEFPPRASVGG